ncbi:Mitochondrial carrier protein [Candidatus Rubidus massiliensis]|nr:Mitochondrial carrier protein [Candidatus Rubidus massiliensis]
MNGLTNDQSFLSRQISSLLLAPLWYPFYARSIFERMEILRRLKPGDLSHNPFFNRKFNYYRGFSATLLVQPIYPFSEWFLHKKISHLERKKQEVTYLEALCYGFFAGAITSFVCNPFEVTLIAAQNKNESSLKAFKRIINKKSYSNLFRGAFSMTIRNGLFAGFIVITPSIISKKLTTYNYHKNLSKETLSLTSTIIPATFFTCIAAPLDIYIIQRQADFTSKNLKNRCNIILAMYKKHGLKVFKTGLKLRLAALIVEIASFHLLEKYTANLRHKIA